MDQVDARAHWDALPMMLGPEGDMFRLLKVSEGRLLLSLPDLSVAAGASGELYILPDGVEGGSGIWRLDRDALLELLTQANAWGRELAYRLDKEGEKPNARLLARRLSYFGTATGSRLDAAKAVGYAVAETALAAGLPPVPMLVIRSQQLDGDTRYLGCANGVLDLEGRGLLTGAAAAKCLVSRTTGVRYDPDARHPDADALWNPPMLAGRDDELMIYVRQSLAWSLRGRPEKGMNLLVDTGSGQGDSGKTTLLAAVSQSLGEYAATLNGDILRGRTSRDGGGGRATPELAPLVLCRFGYIEESNAGYVNAERYKMITGGGEITYRMLHRNPECRYVICSIWGASNGALRVDLSLDAESNRYRPIPMPHIPVELQKRHLQKAWQSDVRGHEARREALLALMVAECLGMPYPPRVPGAVLDMRQEHRAAGAGAMGEWVDEHILVSDAPDLLENRLATSDAWRAYCLMSEGGKGVRQQDLTRRVNGTVAPYPPKLMRVGGKPKQGWQGLRLSDEAQRALDGAQRRL